MEILDFAKFSLTIMVRNGPLQKALKSFAVKILIIICIIKMIITCTIETLRDFT